MISKRTKKAKGFTIIELLVALAITALLMTAVATAFDASAKNFQVNEDIYKAMNAARQTLMRITTELRTADYVFVEDDAESADQGVGYGVIDKENRIYERNYTYHYNNSDDTDLYDNTLNDNTLYSQVFIFGGATTNYLLCENVTAMTFTRTYIDPDAEDDAKKVKNVRIAITVTVDGVSKTLTAAAVIRRNL